MSSSTFQIIRQHFSILSVINTSKCWYLQVMFICYIYNLVNVGGEEGGSGSF